QRIQFRRRVCDGHHPRAPRAAHARRKIPHRMATQPRRRDPRKTPPPRQHTLTPNIRIMSIEAINLSKSYGPTRALDKVSLKVQKGQLVALVGPSGSGKTTLLRILAGLETPDAGSGTLRFHGDDVSTTTARERQVGMVFQH